MIQPHLPVRLPCYDLTLLAKFRFELLNTGLIETSLEWLDGRCVQGAGTYSAKDDDFRLLGIPASRGRVSAHDPN